MFPASPGSPGGTSPSSTSCRSLDELLVCPVCLETYQDPKTLNCLHSFCARCLENCKRSFRRDISCPVCKKITVLTPMGVQGLQNDFRIQQIRDIITSRPQSPPVCSEDATASPQPGDAKFCDICKSQQRKAGASYHCIQCFMYFCDPCQEKHTSNPVFSSHHVLEIGDTTSSENLFCKIHAGHPIRYFCKPCTQMLCTICTLDHDSSHAPEALEKGIVSKYRRELKHSLKSVKSKLIEFNTRVKYLETLKQSHQRALYETQSAIKHKAERAIESIRNEESRLLVEAQEKIEMKMKDCCLDQLGEVNFQRSHIESLYLDLQKVIDGSPQQCLMSYDNLQSRMADIAETSLPAVNPANTNGGIKFVPSTTDISSLMGILQDCTLSDNAIDDSDEKSPSSPRAGGNSTPKSSKGTRRMASILNALSPNRQSETKLGKIKTFSADRPPNSPTNVISADELIGSGQTEDDPVHVYANPTSPFSSKSAVSPQPARRNSSQPGSPSSETAVSPHIDQTRRTSRKYANKPMLILKLDQIGGWPGRIMSPNSVTFLPDGNIVVAESENRLQIFSKLGHSVRIIAWGKIKPCAVIITKEGKIATTDKKDRTVKMFHQDGDVFKSWEGLKFSSPSGLAVMSCGKFVVTDTDKHTLSIHTEDGSVIKQFGSWGSGEYQFNNPVNVTVDQKDNIIVSDAGNSLVKVYDKNGAFIHSFSISTGKQGQIRRPHGICVDSHGNLLIADRESHNIALFSLEGQFQRHVISKLDGVRYPCDVAIDRENNVALVESHSGFLAKDPHHAVKIFQL